MIVLKNFPYVLANLKENLRDIFSELKVSLHTDLVEPYKSTVYVSIDNEFIRFCNINNPQKLNEMELHILSVIPGLSDKIVKIYG